LLAAIALFLGGCAGLVGNSSSSASGEMVVVETVNVYVTGSNIPVRVPKSASARQIPTVSPLVIFTADDMRRIGGPSGPPMH
jgi:hypothetical protein